MKNVPNILTLFRLLLIPVYIIVFCSEGTAKTAAACIFVFASATDVLDGYIARKFNASSKVGQVLDPLADKLMQITVLISLVCIEVVPLWFVIYLAAMQGLMILAGAFLWKNKIYIKSNVFGKANTVILFIAMLVLLIYPINNVLKYIMLSIIVVFSLFTSATYGYLYFIRHKKYKNYNIINKHNTKG